MKKTVLLLIILAGVTANSFAVGIGLSFGLKQKDELVVGPSLLLSSDYSDTIFAVDWFINDDAYYIGATFDYFPLDFDLVKFNRVSSLSLRLGIGMYGDFAIPKEEKELQENEDEWALGFRIPIQAYFNLNNIVSLYFTVAPAYELEFTPSFDVGDFRVPITLGVLFWL
jgi:hypothetical protein